MRVVLDSSVVVAALIDTGAAGEWARDVVFSGPGAAPHLMPAEVANILRRRTASGLLPGPAASVAHQDLLGLGTQLLPFAPFADRAWRLRENLTTYDAWYVALAEALDVPLTTLDWRLSRAPGPRCEFLTPP